MKNLGNVVDQLILIDGNLEKSLKPIKKKWKRYPKKNLSYWKELLTFLNSDDLMKHPDRMKMKEVINEFNKRKRPRYSFETVSSKDMVIGVISGHLADKLRRLDLQSIRIAKELVEANMTHDLELQVRIKRREQILEIETKKIWVSLRDHFDLWDKPGDYNIKISPDNLLFLVSRMPTIPKFMGPGVVKMDPELLKRFFNFMGMQPPPDLFNGSNQ